MPTIFTHAFAAAAVGKSYARDPVPPKFWAWTTLCAVLPDADVLGFAFGVSYGDVLGHRGWTHSLPFAFALAWAFVSLAFRQVERASARFWSLVAYFFVVVASHGALDALTDGGLGVAFFAPFAARRYFLPWRPVEVSPIGAGFFSARGVEVFESELVWVWLPATALVAAVWSARKLIKWRAARDAETD